MNTFFDDKYVKYTEKCICLEEFDIHNPGVLKFCVPTLTPFINSDKIIENRLRINKSNLLNKNKEDINISSDSKIVNYVEIELPAYLTDIVKDISMESECSGGYAPKDGGKCDPGNISTTIKKSYHFPVDDNDIVPEGQEFILTFVSGDINDKKIIGRYK